MGNGLAVAVGVAVGSGTIVGGGVGVEINVAVGTAVAIASIGGTVGVDVGKSDCDGLCAHANARTNSIAAIASTPDPFTCLLNLRRWYPNYPVTCSRHPDPSVLSINSA